MKRSLFVTGSTGVIGRNLFRKIETCGYSDIYCLTRHTMPRDDIYSLRGRVTFVTGSIDEPDRYKSFLEQADTVLHMAAVTGKARRAEYYRVNRDGTGTLIEHCRKAKVKNFLFLSTIAVKFSDVDHYYYAKSKRDAEESVRKSGLDYCIIRPTIVIGKESPIWKNLATLATATVPAVFGNGKVKIQPIHVDDLINCLTSILDEGLFVNETYEVGGHDVVTMEEFLRRIRKAAGLADKRFIHIPVRPLIPLLLAAERIIYPILPFTAGQLASFCSDGIVERNPLFDRWSPTMISADDMIRRILTGG